MNIKISHQTILNRLQQSRLFKDSFWAVSGNGIGYVLLLLSGIIIARFLGKDIYGEYGVVKTTMLYMASFAALGLGFSSTKYIAQYMTENRNMIRSIIYSANKITFISSTVIAICLLLGADCLAKYLEEPNLSISFRVLSIIIICKAMSTTGLGILAGFGAFKQIGICNIVSGIVMIISCIPLTYIWGILGSFISLFISQLLLAVNTHIYIYNLQKKLPDSPKKSMLVELIHFSLPVALQESSYTICNWGAILLLTKFASLGEVGIYSASTQWKAIVGFIPGMLSNVILSHLSGTGNNVDKHRHTIKIMLMVNFLCTFCPFLMICIFIPFIVSFYGSSFSEMTSPLIIYAFSAIISSIINVFNSDLISIGKTWSLFVIRLSRDIFCLIGIYVILVCTNGMNGARNFAIIYIITSFGYLFILIYMYKKNLRVNNSIRKI